MDMLAYITPLLLFLLFIGFLVLGAIIASTELAHEATQIFEFINAETQ